MTPPDKVVTDLLGVQPIAKAVELVTERSLDATAALWRALLRPAAEEVGLILQDRVRVYRLANQAAVAEKASARFEAVGLQPGEVTVHPRLGIAILEQTAWAEDDVLRDMWAGLLVSSATPEGHDESNLMFVDLLSKLTSAQARLLRHGCVTCLKVKTREGLVLPGSTFKVSLNVGDAMKIAQFDDLPRLDRELDHLRELGLLAEGAGFAFVPIGHVLLLANLTPSGFGLSMYMRCQGGTDPVAFYHLTDAEPDREVSLPSPSDVEPAG